MIPYLITGGNDQIRLVKAKEIIAYAGLKIDNLKNNPDLLIIEPALSIGINQIRQIQRFLSRKPYEALIKVVILPQAEKMTLPAQNSFLKTLEEPPAHSLIILCSQTEDQLLPTILSRCQLINLPYRQKTTIDNTLISNYSLLLTRLLKQSAGNRLKLIEPYASSREEAIKFCEEMIIVLRHKLIEKKAIAKPQITNHQLLTIINAFQKTFNLVNANINPRLALDNLVLSL